MPGLPEEVRGDQFETATPHYFNREDNEVKEEEEEGTHFDYASIVIPSEEAPVDRPDETPGDIIASPSVSETKVVKVSSSDLVTPQTPSVDLRSSAATAHSTTATPESSAVTRPSPTAPLPSSAVPSGPVPAGARPYKETEGSAGVPTSTLEGDVFPEAGSAEESLLLPATTTASTTFTKDAQPSVAVTDETELESGGGTVWPTYTPSYVGTPSEETPAETRGESEDLEGSASADGDSSGEGESVKDTTTTTTITTTTVKPPPYTILPLVPVAIKGQDGSETGSGSDQFSGDTETSGDQEGGSGDLPPHGHVAYTVLPTAAIPTGTIAAGDRRTTGGASASTTTTTAVSGAAAEEQTTTRASTTAAARTTQRSTAQADTTTQSSLSRAHTTTQSRTNQKEQTTQGGASQVHKTTQSVSNRADETTKDATRVDQTKQVSPTREVQTTQGHDHTTRPEEPTSTSATPSRPTTPPVGQIKLSEEDHAAFSTTTPPPNPPTHSDHHTRSTTQRAVTPDPSRTACTSTTTSLPTTALPGEGSVDYDGKTEGETLVEAKPAVLTEEGERNGTEGSGVVFRGEPVLERDINVQGRTHLGWSARKSVFKRDILYHQV